jgi:hypothetical protein
MTTTPLASAAGKPSPKRRAIQKIVALEKRPKGITPSAAGNTTATSSRAMNSDILPAVCRHHPNMRMITAYEIRIAHAVRLAVKSHRPWRTNSVELASEITDTVTQLHGGSVSRVQSFIKILKVIAGMMALPSAISASASSRVIH